MKEDLQVLQELIRETAKKYNLEYLKSVYFNDGRNYMTVEIEGNLTDIDRLEEQEWLVC